MGNFKIKYARMVYHYSSLSLISRGSDRWKPGSRIVTVVEQPGSSSDIAECIVLGEGAVPVPCYHPDESKGGIFCTAVRKTWKSGIIYQAIDSQTNDETVFPRCGMEGARQLFPEESLY